MDSEFPDPDEEFELMHAEEMEMLQEYENCNHDDFYGGIPKAKRSLKFTSPNASDSAERACPDSFQSNGVVTQDENLAVSSTSSQSIRPLSMDTNDQEPVNTENLLNALNEYPTTSKRTISDLFGDIDDIDFDDEHASKKAKQDGLTKDEREMLTIETIVFERKRLQEEKLLPRLANASTRSFKSAKPVFSRTVPRWNFMPLTDKKGVRIYTKLHTEEEHEKEVSGMSNQNHTGGLLSVPFEQLQKIAHEQLQIKWNRIEKNEAQRNNQDLEILPSLEAELWVEKYKPKSYLELLSDEGTNRALLQWLKLWDKVVFNRERKVKIKPKEDPRAKGGRFQKKTGPVVCEDLDEHGRPFHKIALLCGPPGLGKTTLAHMIALQAGYNIVEVNASDDRSPEVFRTQLEAATQMRAVMGAQRRPNCLVLDEIDGAPAASIDVVLKFALGKPPAKRKGPANKKEKGSDKTELLKRPIICICNDVYVPALRPLRQSAFVVYFPPTVPARLAQRLVEIARMQSMKADLGAMMTLSEKTNNDIRACLALLQCLKVESGGVVRLSQIHKAAIGQKDLQKGLFTVWQEIFQIPRPKRKTFVEMVERDPNVQARPEVNSSETKTKTSTLSERTKSVLRTVQGCGDYDRLAQGVFENYLNMKIKDSTMISVASGLKWFCFFDSISSKIHSTQNYILYPYLAYPFVLWNLLYANLSWPKLNYPSTGYEMSTRLQRSKQVVDEVLKSMVPAVRAYTYREQLLLDTLPLLLEVVVPNLRPVNLSLYSRAEKEELEHVINIMIDYNLTYTQERTPDGAYIFNMDPNVEEVSRFDGGKGCRSLTYGMRQLVAREVELEKLRRAEASLYRDSLPNNSETSKSIAQPAKKETSAPKGVEKKAFTNHLQRLAPKSIKQPDLKTKDFFGRIIDNPQIPKQLKARTDNIVKSDIWYHFKEGFNNAVRRNIYMADLL